MPLLYPEFYIFGEAFIISFQILLISGGFITILGAFLYLRGFHSSGIILLIGSLVGGLNILSIWGWRITQDERKLRKNAKKLETEYEILRKVKKSLSNYLEENKGKAFTAKALHKRYVEDNNLDVSLTETEKILRDLHLLGTICLDVKENVNYYFVS